MSNTKTYYTGPTGIGAVASAPIYGRMDSAVCKAVVSAIEACAAFFRSKSDSFFRAVKIRRTYEMLARLDDRTLYDIGICRDEIGAAAVHSVDNPDIVYSRRVS